MNNRLTTQALAVALTSSLGLASVSSRSAFASDPVPLPMVGSLVATAIVAVVIALSTSGALPSSPSKTNAYALIKDDAAAYLAEGAQNPSAFLQLIFDKTREEIAKRGETQLSDQDIATILLQ